MKILGDPVLALFAREVGIFDRAKPLGFSVERRSMLFARLRLTRPIRTAKHDPQSATPFTLAHPMGEVVPVTRCNKRALAWSSLASDLRFNS
jgi:hypothetical protein